MEGASGKSTPIAQKPSGRRTSRRLGDVLIADGVIDEHTLRQALEKQKQTGQFLGEILVGSGFVKAAVIGQYLSARTGFPFIDLSEQELEYSIARELPEAIARAKCVLPFASTAKTIRVAFADPLNLATVDELTARLGKNVSPFLALRSDIDDAINRVFSIRHKAESVLERLTTDFEDLSSDEDLEAAAEDAPIVRLVNNIVEGAISSGASDLHLEPNENNVRVRYRLDGLLHEQMIIPKNHAPATVSRLKIMSKMDIAERRRPQDGRFSTKGADGKEYDVRVSIMPTVYGEKAVMRLLVKSASWAVLNKLGFYPEQLERFESFIKRPHGIILVTGPTGSGKSTTLHAALHEINDPALNINTIEDPVEYRLPGVNHIQVNNKIGVNFASGLRTLVRQDPDVIMVGEIRDPETAEIAIQAALTGHLVLSTLHTNDAPGALVRLQHMGVEPFLIASSLIGVVGQRLLRNVCPDCKTMVPATNEQIETFGLKVEKGEHPLIPKGQGCRKCSKRGLRGRTAVYEVMSMSEALRDNVLARSSGDVLKELAIAEGMSTMRQSGIRRMLDGKTTPEEIVRVLYVEE
jgi:type IV pilus assembly protein PilB